MTKKLIKKLIGFVLLFALYHSAEYFVLFHYSPIVFFVLQLAFFVTAWLLAKWHGFTGLAAWGLDTKKGWWKQLLTGKCMGIVLYGSTFAVSLWLKSEKVLQVPDFATIWPQLALFGFGTFFSSFSEDILTRGYLYKHMGDRVPASAFVVISSLIYLLNHIYRLADGWETYLYLFMLGILFATPLVLTKRLWFTGGMHWIGNTTFFYTHSIIQTKEGAGYLSPNTIFIFCIILMLPIIIWLFRLFKMGFYVRREVDLSTNS